MKTAIILGSTGLTGNILLQELLQNPVYSKIKLFSRKSIGFTNPKVEEYLIDLLQLEKHKNNFTADEVFCCIGTTNAKTPNKELYQKIDYGIPVAAAKLCKSNQINTFIVVSALGANHRSGVFYNRIKGEMENTVLTYSLPKTYLLQPSLIGGKRNEKRPGEYFFKIIMKIFNPLLLGPFKKYRTIDPETIVYAMIWLANTDFKKQRIISDEIKELAKKYSKAQ